VKVWGKYLFVLIVNAVCWQGIIGKIKVCEEYTEQQLLEKINSLKQGIIDKGNELKLLMQKDLDLDKQITEINDNLQNCEQTIREMRKENELGIEMLKEGVVKKILEMDNQIKELEDSLKKKNISIECFKEVNEIHVIMISLYQQALDSLTR